MKVTDSVSSLLRSQKTDVTVNLVLNLLVDILLSYSKLILHLHVINVLIILTMAAVFITDSQIMYLSKEFVIMDLKRKRNCRS